MTLQQPSVQSSRSGASVNVYLVVREAESVLLLLRHNTGYCDNQYSLVAGHVEDGESAIDAMIREAYEEANIQLTKTSLHIAHVMHRRSNRANIDIFFTCSDWSGPIINQEPHKCAELKFFPQSHLPKTTIDYVQNALSHISNGTVYSEEGWL